MSQSVKCRIQRWNIQLYSGTVLLYMYSDVQCTVQLTNVRSSCLQLKILSLSCVPFQSDQQPLVCPVHYMMYTHCTEVVRVNTYAHIYRYQALSRLGM